MSDVDPRRPREIGPFYPSSPRPATVGGPLPLRRQPLLRLLLINGSIGAGVALLLVIAVLVTDTARLRTLMLSSSEPWLPLLLLCFGFVVTMCSVAMGTAIMMLPDDDDDRPGGGTAPAVDGDLRPAPVPVRVAADPRQGPRERLRRF